ncbi:MAG: radical SAM protein [Pirellulaceae bacterium]|nr:radical SAM protein [Pirellulaceae bacterium]
MTQPSHPTAHDLFEVHPRTFERQTYVYPVLSRRARGISIGVNLSPAKNCDFNCVYCQVDRSESGEFERIDLGRLADELDATVDQAASGRLFESARFNQTPPALRRLNDIALSGDGEPTLSPDFEAAVEVCAEVRRRHALDEMKLVLITNAAGFHREPVRRALAVLDRNHGEIWAKLDAGTEACYRRVNRSAVPFDRILANLAEAASVRPIVIQTLFARLDGAPPSNEELAAYCGRLRQIVAAGGRIQGVQVHTLARRPAETWVAALSGNELDAIGKRVRDETGLVVEVFGE